MAKIGTAHIELKPVLDEATLDAITERIAEAVAEGVRRGMKISPGVFDSGGLLDKPVPAEPDKPIRARQVGSFRVEY